MKNAQIEGVADKIHFKQADARNMPFEDSSFDIVVSSGALHHITNDFEDHDKLTHEIARVLKPGGQIAIWDLSHMVEATALEIKVIWDRVRSQTYTILFGIRHEHADWQKNW